MRVLSISWLGGLITLVHAASLADLAAELPPCGLQCIEQSIPQSPCELTNSTCICTDPIFAGLVQACVAVNCTPKESLTLARLEKVACGVPVPMSDLGFGLNIWDVQPFEHLYTLLKLFWVDQMLYSVHLYCTKISILCFLSNIFTARPFKIRVIWFGAFVGVCFVITEIVTGLQCLPASFNWTSWDGEHVGHCNDLNGQTYALGAINMFCDIVIFIMPLPELYKLQVNNRQKMELFVVFSLGIVVTTFSIIRLPFLVSLGVTTNPTWDYVEVTIWSIWETELGMICASLPAIRKLLKTIWPNAFSTMSSKMRSAKATKDTGNEHSSSTRERSNIDKKNYYELDERSLIGKGQGDTPNASASVIVTVGTSEASHGVAVKA
ncbi:hypothetical protein B7463_g4576, partial [Scytalidium lignicola]